jgi:hypothetical protein
MKRKVTYRPSKAQSVLGGVVGVIFVLIGLFVAIPQAGLFGLFWTAVAVAITATNFYHAFGSGYIGPDIEITDDAQLPAESPEDRLKKLQSLYDQRLITPEEYEEKRKEILREL